MTDTPSPGGSSFETIIVFIVNVIILMIMSYVVVSYSRDTRDYIQRTIKNMAVDVNYNDRALLNNQLDVTQSITTATKDLEGKIADVRKLESAMKDSDKTILAALDQQGKDLTVLKDEFAKFTALKFSTDGKVGVGGSDTVNAAMGVYDSNGNNMALIRNMNANQSAVGLDFTLQNSENKRLPYAKVTGGIESGDVGAESGWLGLSVRQQGVLSGQDQEVARLVNGMVGIGTKAPQAKLDVAGNVRAQGVQFSTGYLKEDAGKLQYCNPSGCKTIAF